MNSKETIENFMEFYEKLGIMSLPLLICVILASLIILERFFLIIFAPFKRTEKKIYHEISQYKNLPEKILDEKISLNLEQIRQKTLWGMGGLRLLSSLAPIFGLLGTILGIIKSFQAISNHTGAVTANIIASGLWEAMLTTAVGLSISCYCLIFSFLTYMILNMRFQRLSLHVHQFCLDKDMEKYEISK